MALRFGPRVFRVFLDCKEIWHNSPGSMTVSDTLDKPLQAELMDGLNLPLPAREQALADLDRVNRWLWGHSASCRTLLPRIVEGHRCQSLIDLGTGSGRIAGKLKQLALRRGVSLRVIGVDRQLDHLLFGRTRGDSQLRVVADADALPFRDRTADWIISNLLFHHFTAGRNRRILAEMQRVSCRGAVVVDLRRALCARILIRFLLPLLRVGPVASYDGKLSTDQAWCLKDVEQITASMPVEELRRRFPFRFSLVLRSDDSP